MRLPMQSLPVERIIIAQPLASRDGGGELRADGVRPSEYGVQPSGWVDDVVKLAGAAGPILGSFGI